MQKSSLGSFVWPSSRSAVERYANRGRKSKLASLEAKKKDIKPQRKFVVDSVRDLANTLKNEPRIVWFTVELGDTHKPEAIAQSNICFRSFLPSLTLWLSPNVLPNLIGESLLN